MARIKTATKTVQDANSSNPFVVDIPEHESGDLIFVTMNHIGTETTTLTPPGSWTEEFYTITSNQILSYGWWLLASGSSESLSVTLTTGTTREWTAHAVIITGVDQTTPIDGSASAQNVGVPPVGGYDLFPSYSTTVSNCLVLSTAQIRSSVTPLEALFPGDAVTKVGLEKNPVSTEVNIYSGYQFLDSAGSAANPVFMPNSSANQRYTFTHVGIRSADSTERNLYIVPDSAGDIVLPPNVESLYGVTTPGTWPTGAVTINTNTIVADVYSEEGAAAYGAMSNLNAIRIDQAGYRGALFRLSSPYLDLTDKLFLFDWQMVRSSNLTALRSIAEDGLMLVLFSGATEGTNWAAWTVGGFPHDPLGSFYQPIVVDPNESSLYLDEGGTFDPTDIRQVGVVSSMQGVAATILGMLRVAEDIAIVGGGTAIEQDPISFLSQKTFDMGRADFVRQGTAQYRITVPFTIGGTSRDTVVTATAFSAEFPPVADGTTRVNNQTISGRLGVSISCPSGSVINLTNGIFGGGDYYFRVLDALSEGTLSLAGTQIIDAVEVTLAGNFTYSDISFINPPTISDNNNQIRNCTIQVGDAVAPDTGVITWGASTDISNSTFLAADNLTDGHAIVITTAGTYSFTDLTFTGFGANGSDTAVVYNNSGGAVTINVSGGSTPTYRNGAGASTTVVASVPLAIKCIRADTGADIENVRVRIVTDPGGTEILNTLTDVNGEISSSYSGSTPQDITGWARKSSASPFYQEASIAGTITSSGFSATLSMILDE